MRLALRFAAPLLVAWPLPACQVQNPVKATASDDWDPALAALDVAVIKDGPDWERA